MIFNIHNETPEEIENRILEERLEQFVESYNEDLQRYERDHEPMTEEEFRQAYESWENTGSKLP